MRIAVIGAGSWGSAASSILVLNGHNVHILARNDGVVAEIMDAHTNSAYLPGATLPSTLTATSDPEQALSGAELIVVAVPSHVTRETLARLAPALKSAGASRASVVSLTKGLENSTFARMSQVISETLEIPPDRVAALSGPNHAEEVVRLVPSATVVASPSDRLTHLLQQVFMHPMFRVYTNPDLLGVELCAAMKNVLAIAAGISDGLGYGDNTKASLLTRGLAEMTRFGLSFGADAGTFPGLAGIGDLIATATSRHSRNRRVGEELARGATLSDILGRTRMVAEGVHSSRAILDYASARGIELPITYEVVQVLHQGKEPRASVNSLMSRDPTKETLPAKG